MLQRKAPTQAQRNPYVPDSVKGGDGCGCTWDTAVRVAGSTVIGFSSIGKYRIWEEEQWRIAREQQCARKKHQMLR